MRRDAAFWAGMLTLLGAVTGIAALLQNWCAGVVGHKMVVRARKMAFRAALRQEVAFFDDARNSTGALSARLANDAALIRVLVADGIFSSIQNMATFAAGFAIAFDASYQLTFVMMAVMPLTFLSYKISMQRQAMMAQANRGQYDKASQVSTDAVSNIRTVASFTAEAATLALFDAKMAGPLAMMRKQSGVSGLTSGFSALMYPLPQARRPGSPATCAKAGRGPVLRPPPPRRPPARPPGVHLLHRRRLHPAQDQHLSRPRGCVCQRDAGQHGSGFRVLGLEPAPCVGDAISTPRPARRRSSWRS